MKIEFKNAPPEVKAAAEAFDTDKSGTLDESEVLVAQAVAAEALADKANAFATEGGKALKSLLAASRSEKAEEAIEKLTQDVPALSMLEIRMGPKVGKGKGKADQIAADRERLTTGQRRVLEVSQSKAEPLAETARPLLLERFTRLGFTEAQMKRTLKYLRDEAPVTITFAPDKQTPGGGTLAQAMTKGGAYFSTWESGITGSHSVQPGGQRQVWEGKVYQDIFQNENLGDQARPKYTALNGTRSPNSGTNGSFGKCYFIARNGVKNRATIIPDDIPFVGPEKLGTFDHLEHVLMGIGQDTYLQNLVKASEDPTVELPSGANRWQEVHIFGPLDLAKDCATLVIHNSYAGTTHEADLRSLAERHGLDVRWTDGNKTWTDGEAAP